LDLAPVVSGARKVSHIHFFFWVCLTLISQQHQGNHSIPKQLAIATWQIIFNPLSIIIEWWQAVEKNITRTIAIN
jgi:hypothetical protein